MCVTHMTCLSGDVCKKQPDPLEGLLTSPERFALFLDIDGTLLDIAPTPGAVAVPGDLGSDLAALSRHLHGSLALVTGRSIAMVDALFAPPTLCRCRPSRSGDAVRGWNPIRDRVIRALQ